MKERKNPIKFSHNYQIIISDNPITNADHLLSVYSLDR